jgi:2-polyprenyl-3-methyl-5-hydroxy-6-metoxy-1,4-benzoquinol methylase/uncharacterized protein YbaR (Trm112 family)
MNEWLLENLACPKHKLKLTRDGKHLNCSEGDHYPIVDGIPVLLFDDGRPAHGHIKRTLEQIARIESGESAEGVIPTYSLNDHGVDEFVIHQLPFTCGNLYFSLQKNLTRYPFPEIRLPASDGKRLLDLGCSWGRWTIPAARKGYATVGMDPDLEGALAAKRIAKQLGIQADFVVADAAHLPFLDNTFDVVFSFSVLQHLAKSTVIGSLAEISRVVSPEGQVLVQFPNRFGVRSMYHQAKNFFQTPNEGTDVFYWSPAELTREFNFQFGETDLSVDCFFGLNLQATDADLMPLPHRTAIFASEVLKKVSGYLPPLRFVADSLYVSAKNNKSSLQPRG